MKKWRNKVVFAVGLLVLVLLGIYWWQSGGQEAETIKVVKGSITRTVDDSGYVQLVNQFDIQASQTARVLQIMCEAGDKVVQGQPLVTLENLDLSVQTSNAAIQLLQAKAALASAQTAKAKADLALGEARAELARMEKLLAIGAVSQVDYDQARLAVENDEKSQQEQQELMQTSEAQIQELTSMTQKLQNKEQQLIIKSPADGRVQSLPITAEQVVSPGMTVVKVGVTGAKEVKAYILSDDLADIRIGQNVKITAPVLNGKTLEGQVKKIYPEAEEKTSALGVIQRRVPVTIAIPDEAALQPGYEVKVSIITKSIGNVLVLPREALRTRADGAKEVMQVIGGRVKFTRVEAGINDNDYIEIKSGLQEGDIVVRDTTLDLPEKTRIKVKK